MLYRKGRGAIMSDQERNTYVNRLKMIWFFFEETRPRVESTLRQLGYIVEVYETDHDDLDEPWPYLEVINPSSN